MIQHGKGGEDSVVPGCEDGGVLEDCVVIVSDRNEVAVATDARECKDKGVVDRLVLFNRNAPTHRLIAVVQANRTVVLPVFSCVYTYYELPQCVPIW